MAGGRPLKFKTVEELQVRIQDFFNAYKKDGSLEGHPMTLSGLAYFLDIDTQTLFNYEKRDEFFESIKRAKQLIEMAYEEKLHSQSTSGAIFALKNFKWKDTQEITRNPNEEKINADERILELLNKCGAAGVKGITGKEMD